MNDKVKDLSKRFKDLVIIESSHGPLIIGIKKENPGIRR